MPDTLTCTSRLSIQNVTAATMSIAASAIETISRGGECFNKTRSGSVVEQYPPYLANAEVDASLDIDVNVVTPDALADFVTGDNFGSALNQQSQNLAGLVLEFQRDTPPRKRLTR